jgi:peptide/nickel transport system ATP-binding protein
MYLGKVVEVGTREQVYERPTHPWTQSLLDAVPGPDPAQRGRGRRTVLSVDVPTLPLVLRPGSDHPSACLFASTDLPLPQVRQPR